MGWYIYIHENLVGPKQISISLHSNFINNNQEEEGLIRNRQIASVF